MWREAAKQVGRFTEGVITALDADGDPVSVRQTTLAYDPQTGEMPVALPEALGATAGPANLLCHFHDDKVWNLRAISVKGVLEKRESGWVFVTSAFTPPSTLGMLRGMRRATRSYLAKRGLPMPKVDFDVIARLWEQAAKIVDP